MAGILMPAIFLCIYRIKRKDRRNPAMIWLCIWPLAAVLGAICCWGADCRSRLYDRLDETEESCMVLAEGTVVRIEEKDRLWIYLKNTKLSCREEGQAALFPPSQGEGVIVLAEGERPLLGSRLCAEGKLELFSQATNPGVFDQRSYYHNQGYDFCLTAESRSQAGKQYDPVAEALYRFKNGIRQRLFLLCKQPYYGIFCAVLLGDRQELDPEQKELFQEQGIAHILSVSGLHISAVGMLVYGLLMHLTGSFACSGIAGSLLVMAYGAMTGGAVSTVRASVMYLLLVLGRQRGRIYDMPSAAAAAALFLLLLEPLALFQASMQLSFGAVLGLSLTAECFQRIVPKAGRHSSRFFSVMGLSITLLPITLWHYYQYPTYSLLLNALILPFAGLLMAVPAVCAAVSCFSLTLAQGILQTGVLVIRWYNLLCHISQKLPGSVRCPGRPAVWRMIVYGLLLFLIAAAGKAFVRRKRAARQTPVTKKQNLRIRLSAELSAVCFFLFGVFFLHADRADFLTVTMLDVGQGDGVLMELPDQTVILSDAGSSSRSQLADYVLEPVLQAKGISTIDCVLVSHGDSDHMNGVIDLLKNRTISVRRLMLPDIADAREQFAELLQLAAETCTPVTWLAKGDQFSLGPVSFTVLWPDSGASSEDSNALSLVYRLSYRDFSMLFTGDLPQSEENRLIESGLLQAAVLKIAHHGSNSSTGTAFLDRTSPLLAILSCGRNNRYGHPHEETLERLEEAGVSVLRTDESGAIEIKVESEKVTVFGYVKP